MAKRFTVEAVFKGVDRVSKPITRMQNRIGKMTRSMTRGLRRANKMLDKVIRGFRRGVGAVAKFGGAIVGAASAAAITAITRVSDAVDSLAKRARRLKFPIEELQEWQFVAEQSGISSESFDKSLEKFTKSVGEAKAGTGTLITILKKANPELLKQIQSASSAGDAFDLYLDAIRKTEDQTVKTALATAAFGRTGAKFINITEQSAEAVAALRKEQRENGVVTAQQAAAAEAFNDSVNSLQRSLGGLLQEAILPLLPALTETTRGWREWIVANKDLLKSQIAGFIDRMKTRITDLVTAVQEFNKRYNIGERIEAGLDAIERFSGFLAENAGTIFKLVIAAVALSAVLKTLALVLTVVNLVMAANPVTLIVLGIFALIAAVSAAIVWFDKFREILQGVPRPLIAAIAILGGPIGFLIAAATLIIRNWEPLGNFFTALWGGVVTIFTATAAGLGIVIGGAASLVMAAWEPVGAFFADLWGGIVSIFETSIAKIVGLVNIIKKPVSFVIDKIASIGGGIADKLGIGENGATADGGVVDSLGIARDEVATETQDAPQVVTPQERMARTIEESRQTSSSEVTLKADAGTTAEVTKGKLGNGITLQPSGAF